MFSFTRPSPPTKWALSISSSYVVGSPSSAVPAAPSGSRSSIGPGPSLGFRSPLGTAWWAMSSRKACPVRMASAGMAVPAALPSTSPLAVTSWG